MSTVTILYPELVNLHLVSSLVQFADLDTLGHRVQVPMSVSTLNDHFQWTRSVGQEAPVGFCANTANFVYEMTQSLNQYSLDLDRSPTGLAFDTVTFLSLADSRLQKDQAISANDWVLSYVLYKLYGKTQTPTRDFVFNEEDAQNLVTSEAVAFAIGLSMYSTQGQNAIAEMFRQLLEKSPSRFADASGVIPSALDSSGLDVSGSGSWNFQVDDTVEVRTECIFHSPVFRKGYSDMSGSSVEIQSWIQSGEAFRLRLQFLATPDWSWTDYDSSGVNQRVSVGNHRLTHTNIAPEWGSLFVPQGFSNLRLYMTPQSTMYGVFGFTTAPSGYPGDHEFQYGIYCVPNGQWLSVYDGNFTGFLGTYDENTLLGIEVQNQEVRFVKNGETVQTFTSSYPYTLYAKATLAPGTMWRNVLLIPS